jgi:hypothetical protein
MCIYDRALSEEELSKLVQSNQWQAPDRAAGSDSSARERLIRSLGAVGLENLPTLETSPAAASGRSPGTVIRQARVRRILDDKLPAWRVMDGRMNLFWPEWRAPVLGDVDYSGSELRIEFEPGQKLTHLVLRGLVGSCQIFGMRDDYASREPIVQVPAGLHYLAADRLPSGLSGLRIPRREGMKLHELGAFAVHPASGEAPRKIVTPITGLLELSSLGPTADELRTRNAPEDRSVLGNAAGKTRKPGPLPPLGRIHLLSDPVVESVPLDAVQLRLVFTAGWKEDIWWLRVPDPVNPRRDLMHLPLRVHNAAPGREAVLDVVLDFWDIMLDRGARLAVELMPTQEVQFLTGDEGAGQLSLWPGERAKVLAEFGHTQSQLAFSYWQLGSEADGTRGADASNPGFALLGHITHNRELKLTLEWVRRHLTDQPLVNNLWGITFGKQPAAPVTPRRQPSGAPQWAVWGRELLERFRHMAHHWADAQGPDGQLGGGWNDDTDFPGVFICLPLVGDKKTQRMFTRLYDGLEKTGYLRGGVSRSPIDALHATDFLSWRAHLMLLDYGEPRHIERALDLNHELHKWTRLDAKGRRQFLSGYYSEDGPQFQPRTQVGDSGLIESIEGDHDSPANRNFLRDLLFCAWYSRNPAVLKFLREVAEADYAEIVEAKQVSEYRSWPMLSYYTLFGESKYIDAPLDRFFRGRGVLPMWRRLADRLPNGDRFDAQLLAAGKKPAGEEVLAAAYWISKDKSYLVRALRDACERLEGGWQFRGGAALGANDHFSVPGQGALSQMYLGAGLSWLRPASIIPPLASSWEGLDDDVAAIVLESTSKKLRVAVYNFDGRPRPVRLRVWELAAGKYSLREGPDANDDDQIDGPAKVRELSLQRASPIELELPSQKVYVVQLNQVQAQARPELLPDLAVGEGDIFYDLATDRLKVVVHNLGAAAAENVTVRFEDPQGKLLQERAIPRLEPPLDLRPKTVTVWLSQPTLHPAARIVVRIDPAGRLEEITRENNSGAWMR